MIQLTRANGKVDTSVLGHTAIGLNLQAKRILYLWLKTQEIKVCCCGGCLKGSHGDFPVNILQWRKDCVSILFGYFRYCTYFIAYRNTVCMCNKVFYHLKNSLAHVCCNVSLCIHFIP